MAITIIGSADSSASGDTNALAVANVTASAGDILIAGTNTYFYPVGSTASSISFGSRPFVQGIAYTGTSDPLRWTQAGLWYHVVTASTTATVSAVYAVSSSCSLTIVKMTAGDTVSPLGATGTAAGNTQTTSITLSASTNDVAFYGVASGQGAADTTSQSSTMAFAYNSFASFGNGWSVLSFSTASGSNNTGSYQFINQLGIPEAVPYVHVGMIIKGQAAGSSAAAFFAYSRNYMTAGAI